MKKYICTLLIFLPAFPFLSKGQPANEDTIKNYNLNEITIRSPKYNSVIFNVPAAATMIPARSITNAGMENLTAVSTMVPNFFMPDYGSKLTSPVYIRGVGNRINTPSVGLYVDEIPYFEKSAFNFDFFDIERIEVLRGPQGTLYGRNAMGGLINITTNNPDQKRHTVISADYGNFNQVRTSVSHNQPVTKNLAFMINLNNLHNDGFYENIYNASRVDKMNSYSGRSKVLFTPSDNLRLLLSLQYEDSRQGGYPYAIFNDQTRSASLINYDSASIYNRKMLSSGLNFNYTAKKFLIRMVSSYQSIKDLQNIDQDFTPKSLYFVSQDQKLNMISQEINFQSRNTKKYEWMFGAFGFRQLLDKSVSLHYGKDYLLSKKLPYKEYYYIKEYGNSNSGLAFFHQSTLKLGPVSATAGVRADYEKATLDYAYNIYKDGVKTNSSNINSQLDFFEILPKIAFTWHITGYMTPYATISKGYNSGGFNSTFEREEDRTFKPEESWNYEAGFKAKWLQKQIYANLAFFYIDWTNQQIYQTVPSGTGSMLTNAGKSASKGFEAEVKMLPAKNLETWATFGYIDARFVEYVQDNKTDYSGNFIPYVPRFSFNTGGNYTIEMKRNWLDRIRVNLAFNGFGKHYWNENNQAWEDFYALLSGRLGFEKGKISLSFWGKNLLNTKYNSFYFQALGNSYAQIGKPASMGINLKLIL